METNTKPTNLTEQTNKLLNQISSYNLRIETLIYKLNRSIRIQHRWYYYHRYIRILLLSRGKHLLPLITLTNHHSSPSSIACNALSRTYLIGLMSLYQSDARKAPAMLGTSVPARTIDMTPDSLCCNRKRHIDLKINDPLNLSTVLHSKSKWEV